MRRTNEAEIDYATKEYVCIGLIPESEKNDIQNELTKMKSLGTEVMHL
jgi:hypothetical protein